MALPPLPPLPPVGQFHPKCKVCDQGELIAKKVFRMSGPAVAIGYILLIPSILGMLAAAWILFGVSWVTHLANTTNTTVDEIQFTPPRYVAKGRGDEVEFRRACINTPMAYRLDRDAPWSQYCECELSLHKQNHSLEQVNTNDLDSFADAINSRGERNDVCVDLERNNRLPSISEQTDKLYDSLVGAASSNDKPMEPIFLPHTAPATAIFGIVGSTLAIALGIGSFVGGLLGWLLVMKKRVLQCAVCGATVNAS
jgi:hypothetical protein